MCDCATGCRDGVMCDCATGYRLCLVYAFWHGTISLILVYSTVSENKEEQIHVCRMVACVKLLHVIGNIHKSPKIYTAGDAMQNQH